MRDFLGGWFLIPFLALGLGGIFLPPYRLPFFAAALLLLVAGVGLQSGTRGRKRGVMKQDALLGPIHLLSGRLHVTDKWDLSGADTIPDVRPGAYEISLSIGLLDGTQAVLQVALGPDILASELAESEERTIAVDTGALVLADAESEQQGVDKKQIKTVTLRVMDGGEGQSSADVLRDKEGRVRGLVVATGVGDGIYPLRIKRARDGRTRIECAFAD